MRLTTAGESHGRALVAIIEGIPAHLHIDTEKINAALALRQQGFGRGSRQKIEKDKVEILSGVRNEETLGSPITLCIFNKEDPQEVLASWLFAQYLLTKDVQYSYATTEGYVPVTSQTQQSAEYQDYLSRAGEDNDFYYQVKLDATMLLLNNVENTFVTPVFIGSASLRDAAGQLIEDTVRTIRRKEDFNEETVAKMFENMTTMYHLDEISVDGEWKKDFGPLPQTALILLYAMVTVWVVLGVIFITKMIKRKEKRGA